VHFCVWTGLSRAEAGLGATMCVCVCACVGGLSVRAFSCVDRTKQSRGRIGSYKVCVLVV